MSKIKKSILCFLSVILILLTSLLQPLSVVAASTSSELSFESSNVLDDLFSSTVDGVPFDIKNFPFNEKSSIQILNFVEFCYTYKESLKDDYGLYVYVYNPQGLDIDKTSKQNKIQLATYSDEFGEHYDKFELEFINEAEQSNYKGLFYKYKIVDKKSADGKTLIDRVNSNERVYKVSGIELLTKGNSNATEYGVGGTYKFTGYAKGYGPDVNAESNLVCTVENLETLSLDVHHTNYRTGVSSLGADHYNEVNTVYFAVPNRIFEEYGNLQKIRAEWWEYKTKMAAITSNYDYYQNTLMKYIGTYTGEHNSSVDNYLYSGYEGKSGSGYALHYFDWTYNKDLTSQTGLFTQTYTSKKVSDILPYAFYSPAVDVDSVFKFLYSDPIAGSVDSTQVAEWIYNYSNSLGHGYIDCNGRKISKDLFESSVDSGRTMGYNDKTIDLGDTFDLNSYDSNHNWWDKLWDYGFSWPDTSEQYSNVAPIYELKESDLSGSDTDISKRLLINSDDVDELKDFFDEAEANDERVILFRFANTDYYCAPAFAPHVQNITKTDTYVAQQTVFLDFDIIELTFNKDGVYHVIPVVSSPMDVINGFTPPPAEFEWWKIVLALLILVLIIVLIYPILPYVISFIMFIVKWVIRIILFPFKMIGKLFKRKKRKPKAKDEANTNTQ